MAEDFIVKVPATCSVDRCWVISVILGEFLGLNYVIEENESYDVEIHAFGKKLILPDTFFLIAGKNWLNEASLPSQQLQLWDSLQLPWEVNLVSPKVPVIYGEGEFVISQDSIALGLDIFGSAFFMLSRYEEVVKDARDRFNRFPAFASLAYQAGFLDRPIINEYLEILWSAMKYLWPGLDRKKRDTRMLVSADVDAPYNCYTKSVTRLCARAAGDILKRGSIWQCVNSFKNYFASRAGNRNFDSNFQCFDWMMDVNEKVGNHIAFYFIVEHSSKSKDGCYRINEPTIQSLMQRIYERGHEIGLHQSFNTYKNLGQTKREADRLRSILDDKDIHQDELGGRQHFLRWETPTTAINCESAGIAYDTSLSYADHAGFRCGICYEYPFYDVVQRKPLNIRERPLVVMDGSVFDVNYMNYGYDELALNVFQTLKYRCIQFDGDFTLLWHNSQFPHEKAKEMYEWIIS